MSDAEIESVLLASRLDSSQPKPSVEAVFHAYLLSLPGIEVVGHTHPIGINSILCAGEESCRRFALERRFPDEIVCCGAKSVFVPYVDPGIVLAQTIRDGNRPLHPGRRPAAPAHPAAESRRHRPRLHRPAPCWPRR